MALKVSGRVRDFSEMIVSTINEAITDELQDNKSGDLTIADFWENLLEEFLEDGEKYDSYKNKIAGYREFTDDDIKAIIKVITTKSYSSLLFDLIGKSLPGYRPKEKETLCLEIGTEFFDKLSAKWEKEFPVREEAELNIGQLIGFYFLHFLRNRVDNRLKISRKEKNRLVERPGEVKKLDEIFAENNMVIITGGRRCGKTSFVRWYSVCDNRDYYLVDGNKCSDMMSVVCSVQFEEDNLLKQDDFLKETGLEENPYKYIGGVNEVKNRISGMPGKLTLIIDDFNGDEALLKSLDSFLKGNPDADKIRIIVISERKYETDIPTLQLEELGVHQLEVLFEKYSGVSLKDDRELKILVDKLSLETRYWPQFMILFAEAYSAHCKKNKKLAFDLLRDCLKSSIGKKQLKNEKTFHSSLDGSDLKLRGHIRGLLDNLKGIVNGEVFFLLSCLNGVYIPEYYLKKLCSLTDSDIMDLLANHWAERTEWGIRVKIPSVIISSLLDNDDDRQKALDCIQTFFENLTSEVQDVESETIRTEWVLSLIGRAVDFEEMWSDSSFEKMRGKKEFVETTQSFYLWCVRYYVQNFDFEAARHILDFKMEMDEPSKLVIRIWKAIVYFNDRVKNQTERSECYENMLLPLREEVNIAPRLKEEQSRAYLELYEYLLDTNILNFIWGEAGAFIDAQGVSDNHYKIFLAKETQDIFTEYSETWAGCNKGNQRPFKNENYYGAIWNFLKVYSNFKITQIPISADNFQQIQGIFICFLQEMICIWEDMKNHCKQRRERITAFNWNCEILCLKIMHYSLVLDKRVQGYYLSENAANIKEWQVITVSLQSIDNDYGKIKDFLPEISKVRFDMADTCYKLIAVELKKSGILF